MVGSSGLRVELCGPIRLLRADPTNPDDPPAEVRGALTAGQVGLLAYLAMTAARREGVTTDTATRELWPDRFDDGTHRTVHPDTLKKRVWALRRAIRPLLASGDPKEVIPEAINRRYHLTNIAVDWTELLAAIRTAETSTPGQASHLETADQILRLVRPPRLLYPPPARHGVYTWLDHYEPLAETTSSRAQTILADHATHLTATGRPDEALFVLRAARATTPTWFRHVAAATVHAHLAIGDRAAATAVVDAYEADLDPHLRHTELTNPAPDSPRRALHNKT
jgi:hypothetical protein